MAVRDATREVNMLLHSDKIRRRTLFACLVEQGLGSVQIDTFPNDGGATIADTRAFVFKRIAQGFQGIAVKDGKLQRVTVVPTSTETDSADASPPQGCDTEKEETFYVPSFNVEVKLQEIDNHVLEAAAAVAQQCDKLDAVGAEVSKVIGMAEAQQRSLDAGVQSINNNVDASTNALVAKLERMEHENAELKSEQMKRYQTDEEIQELRAGLMAATREKRDEAKKFRIARAKLGQQSAVESRAVRNENAMLRSQMQDKDMLVQNQQELRRLEKQETDRLKEDLTTERATIADLRAVLAAKDMVIIAKDAEIAALKHDQNVIDDLRAALTEERADKRQRLDEANARIAQLRAIV